MRIPTRGEIYLVAFDPTLGTEIRKTRPALVLQNDIANRHSPITIVAVISSKFDDALYEVADDDRREPIAGIANCVLGHPVTVPAPGSS